MPPPKSVPLHMLATAILFHEIAGMHLYARMVSSVVISPTTHLVLCSVSDVDGRPIELLVEEINTAGNGDEW